MLIVKFVTTPLSSAIWFVFEATVNNWFVEVSCVTVKCEHVTHRIIKYVTNAICELR